MVILEDHINNSVSDFCKDIIICLGDVGTNVAKFLKYTPLINSTDISNIKNIYDEKQLYIILIISDFYKKALSKISNIRTIYCPILNIKELVNDDGLYDIYYDPLENYLNLDYHQPLTSTFMITVGNEKNVVSAGYFLFSFNTTFVLAHENKCHIYLLAKNRDWVLYKEKYTIPDNDQYYKLVSTIDLHHILMRGGKTDILAVHPMYILSSAGY